MPVEPAVKRAIAFVDGQNLFHNSRNVFGYTYPNYDVQKLAMMGRRGVVVFSRPLVYRNKTVQVPGFGTHTFLTDEEKGIDVRLALDALDAAHRRQFDVALIFSQNQDLSELGSLMRQVAGFQSRWIKIASAFPDSPSAPNRRGINGTDWCPIDKSTYDGCIDPRDYRPRP